MIKYVRFSLRRDYRFKDSLIACYQQVFAEEPWDEWKKCQLCETKWGLGEKEKLEKLNFYHCGYPVLDFWSYRTVESDMYSEINDRASCWVAIDDLRVVGFCWGYSIHINELEMKLKLPGLAGKTLTYCNGNNVVAYQDEIGVLKHYRGQGIAKEMFLKRLKDFQSQGLKIGIVRTLENISSVPYQWYQKIGYRIIDRYDRHDNADRRVILAQDLSDIY